MARTHAWLQGLALLGLVAVTGCQRSTVMEQFRPPPLPVGPSAHAEAQRPSKDLSPDKAARVCLGTANEMDRAGKYPEAIKLYDRARTTDPKLAPQIARRVAVLCDFVGDSERAQVEYELALKHFPKDADLWSDYGYSWYCRGDWHSAEKHLRRALILNTKLERAWVNLGMALSQQERYEESLQAFARVVSPAQAYCNVAFALLTQGKTDEAKAYYQAALSRDATLKVPNQVLAKLDAPATRPAAEGNPFADFQVDPQLKAPAANGPFEVLPENQPPPEDFQSP